VIGDLLISIFEIRVSNFEFRASNFAFRIGKNIMNRLWIALRAIVYVPLFLAAWGSLALMCRGLDKYIPLRVPTWLVAPGVVLGLAGAALSLTTVGLFIFQGRGTPAVFHPPKKFVPHGPYRLVRNPMYIGGVAMLLGLALYFTSMAMALYAVVAFLIIHTFVVFAEEPGLRKRFGQEYEDYCRTVPRWIPRLIHRHLPN
jgi:protein-S-isoprenylcysteine O-methyltransferase Ste14